MVNNYGAMAAKGLAALTALTVANHEFGEEKTVLWNCNTAAHVVTFLAANVLSRKNLVSNQVATAVQAYAGLTLVKTAIDNYAPVSVKEWTADYMKPLVNLVAGAALATVFASREINFNKFI
ncbi:MAG: hypothetical protein ChlgKO_12210 [Chlamydiales bacterium]